DAVQENPEPQSNQHSDDRQEGPQVADGYKEEAPQAKKDATTRKLKLGQLKVCLRQLEDDLVRALSVKNRKEAKHMAIIDSIRAAKDNMEELKKIAQDQKVMKYQYAAIIYQQLKVLDCDPYLGDMKEFIQELNQTNGLFKFARIMREKFQATTLKGAISKDISMFPDTSTVSTPAPAASISCDGSDSSEMEKEVQVQLGEIQKLPRKVNHGRVGTFWGNERSIPSSGFGNGFLPVELEVQRTSGRPNSKRLFSLSIQSGSGLSPVAEDIQWDLPEPSFKLRRLFESSPTHDPVLATHDLVKFQQRVAYEDILISRSCKSDLWTYEPSILSSFSYTYVLLAYGTIVFGSFNVYGMRDLF
ncbi:hypothetical protein GIB67_034990, partial [Kingdonia uniflora]